MFPTARKLLSLVLLAQSLIGCAHQAVQANPPLRLAQESAQPRVHEGAALGTRAAPFAAYITAMHRQIHRLFTLGFLSDIDLRKDAKFADQTLWVQLSIIVNGDGSLARVSIVRTSGVLAFDVAAIDSVQSASPFPPPPQAIMSVNGKVYLDWQFHRDERACGTFGVDPHVLDTVGNIPHDTSEIGAGPAPARTTARTAVRTAPSPELDAGFAAEGWFAAYARHDVAWLAGWSATPFMDAGDVIARDAPTLKEFYRQLVDAGGNQHKIEPPKVLTPDQVRGELGGLPPGGEPTGMLYAIGRIDGDPMILLLKESNHGWRVCGIDR